MDYQLIDFDSWPRRGHYDFFRRYASPVYGLTANVDITRFLREIKGAGLPFYYSIIHVVTAVQNHIEAYRYRFVDEKIALFDQIDPAFLVLRPGEELFFGCGTDWVPDIRTFTENAKAAVQNSTGAFQANAARGKQRENIAVYTAVTGVSFTQFNNITSLNWFDAKPKICFGRYFRSGDAVLLPISLEIHHAFVDGFHLNLFFEKLQADLDAFTLQ